MKIKSGRLQQIIKEELSRVLKEEYNPDYDKVFMVVAQPYGKLTFWPNERDPDFYDNEEDAVQFSINKSSKSGAAEQWYSLSVTDVLARLKNDDRFGPLKQRAQTYLDNNVEVDNDLDSDNDGMISAAELADEIEDMADDLYVVIGNAGRGRQNMWPSSDEPGVYSKEEAERIAKEREKKQRSSFSQVYYHVKPLVKASEFVSMGTRARMGLNKLLDKYGVDPE